MLAAFENIYLIRVDIDQWGWDHESLGFYVPAIPIFFKVNDQGQSTGEVIDGGAWDENIPENMAPALDAFFHE
ncbi:MAG: hypothetical protein RBS68_15970 [Anaerolineales bacterium]|jgi:hypothetical protein|nr:hypothetical protein [Anaerolineales bacterium]